MFGKLLMIVIVAALTAICLLEARHRRIEIAHEMTRVHQHSIEQERGLWALRGEIARRCRPEAVRERLEALPVKWQAIPRSAPRTPPAPEDDPVAVPVDPPVPVAVATPAREESGG